MRKKPEPYQIYKHFKGNLYQILSLAQDSESCEMMVVYQALYSPYQVWVRTLNMFMDEVDKKKYPEAAEAYRFTLQENLQDNMAEEAKSITAVKSEKVIVKPEAEFDTEADEMVMDPLVMEFLDSNSYEAKLNILAALHHRITDEMINTIAMAMDVEVLEGDIEDRFRQLQNCVATLKKYEGSRLR